MLIMPPLSLFLSFFFFFNDTATTEIYTLSLHDALPILDRVLATAGDEQDVVDARASRASEDRKSTRLNSSHTVSSYAVFCLKKKKLALRAPVGTRSSNWCDGPCRVVTMAQAFHATAASRVFFFHDTATTEIYTLSLHDALPISSRASRSCDCRCGWPAHLMSTSHRAVPHASRSEEHTSELQSHSDLVCRLL